MKREVVEYIAKLLECQLVKVDCIHLVGLLQPIPIPKWKWEVIIMDLVTGLPRTSR